MIAAVFVSLVLLLALGVPVAFGIGLSGSAALVANGQIPLDVIAQRAFAALDSWALMAVPLFILAGELMNACGISRRAIAVVGRLRGGLPIVSVTSSMFFAGIFGELECEHRRGRLDDDPRDDRARLSNRFRDGAPGCRWSDRHHHPAEHHHDRDGLRHGDIHRRALHRRASAWRPRRRRPRGLERGPRAALRA